MGAASAKRMKEVLKLHRAERGDLRPGDLLSLLWQSLLIGHVQGDVGGP
jgi:hypothetical protein